MDSSTIQQVKSRMGIAGTAPQIDKAVNRALRVAPTDLSVLVTGESGAGKEFFPASSTNILPANMPATSP